MSDIKEDLFRDLIENTSDLIQFVTPDGHFLYVNRAWRETLGYNENEVGDLTVFDIIHPDSRQHCLEFFAQMQSGQMVDKIEAQFVAKYGKKIIVEGSIHSKFVDEKLAHLQCIFHDITEQKKMEMELLKSEKKYIDLYQNAPAGYHSLGPDGTILEVNNTWLKILGYERSEVIGKMKLTDIITPESQKTFRDAFSKFKKTGFADNIELALRKKDGTALPVLISATAVYDNDGNFLKSRSIVRDISARVGYRHMLENALEEWRVTFDSMPYGVLLLDMDFTIRRTNKYFMIHYDLPDNKVTEQKCYEVIRSDRLLEIYNSLRINRPVNLNTFEHYEKNTNKYFLINLTPTPDRKGITGGFVLVLVDITELKEKENQLSESRDAFFNMLKELDSSYRELKGLHEGLIHSFVNAIDAKSPWTKGHSERVTSYAVSIAQEMALKQEEIENLRIAALLHDIGKIGTYDVILDNPNILSPQEFDLINMHPVKGVEIIGPIKQLEPILPVIRHHHERIDGKGYPDGLKGEEIPPLAKILCIADAYDSMTSDRPYRPAGSREYAMSELIRCSNTQFDPRAVEAFLRVLNTFSDK